MIIANPVYDVVFKYLLEDIDIARELLSVILGEEILNLEFKHQEATLEIPSMGIRLIRFNFHALIKTTSGETKKVLIELQKAKKPFDIARFRRYLGENYSREEEVLTADGKIEKKSYPILTIYFLGFNLKSVNCTVLKVNRTYHDVTTNTVLKIKDDFVELLTHDSFIIQIPRLNNKTRTKLERVLQVFSQEFKTTNDNHQLDFLGDDSDPLVKKIVYRLERANADEQMRRNMNFEEEIEGLIDRGIEEKDAELKIEKQRADEEKRRADDALKVNAELLRKIDELEKQNKNKN